MKETKKQIKAQIINDLSKKYNEKLKTQHKKYIELNNYCSNLYKGYKKLEEEYNKLKEENESLKDWINRLIEYLELPEDAREQAKMEWIKQKTIREQEIKFLNSPIFKIYENLINSL